jgi:hypothetical protein
MAFATIYVALLDEGTDVWRPVSAEPVGNNVFRIDPRAKMPDDERWEYGPGETVRCRQRRFESGSGLEAFEAAI